MATHWPWSVCFAGALLGLLQLIYSEWRKPKMIEQKLKAQGVNPLPHPPRPRSPPKVSSKRLFHDISPLIWPSYPDQLAFYGKIFFEWRRNMPSLIILDSKMIQEMLNKPLKFVKPEVHWALKYFLLGLAHVNGEKWLSHRRILNPAFHTEKLKQMMPTFMRCCEEMVERWDKQIGSNESCELDAYKEFLHLTEEIISNAAFGTNLQHSAMIVRLQREQIALFMRSFVTSNRPWSRYLPSRLKRDMEKIRAQVSSLIGAIVYSRLVAIISGENENDNLLTAMLKSNLSEGGMTREDIVEEIKLFFFAGHESTANLLTWTLILLGENQVWQEKAREEVFKIIGKNKPTFDQLNNLKIVNMILLEVLRLYPPTSIVRWTHKETRIGPGPRICIARNFGLLEAKVGLAVILQRFLVELSSTYIHEPTLRLTLKPSCGAQVVVRRSAFELSSLSSEKPCTLACDQ